MVLFYRAQSFSFSILMILLFLDRKLKLCSQSYDHLKWMIARWSLDDRLMIAGNIYIFHFFFKIFSWRCWETYYCEFQIKKNRSCFEQSSGIGFCSLMMMMMLLLMILAQTVFVYLCICVFVFVYFDVRHLGTLFLRSSNNILFKNIAHDRSISKFYPNCICVFVYLYLCIWLSKTPLRPIGTFCYQSVFFNFFVGAL